MSKVTGQNPQWKVIRLRVEQAQQIYSINYKLNPHIQNIKGIYFSVQEPLLLGQKSIPHLGELSMLFNAEQVQPLHYMVDYQDHLPDKFKPMPLDVQVQKHQNITGFYLDNGQTLVAKKFNPYTLLIYLECYG